MAILCLKRYSSGDPIVEVSTDHREPRAKVPGESLDLPLRRTDLRPVSCESELKRQHRNTGKLGECPVLSKSIPAPGTDWESASRLRRGVNTDHCQSVDNNGAPASGNLYTPYNTHLYSPGSGIWRQVAVLNWLTWSRALVAEIKFKIIIDQVLPETSWLSRFCQWVNGLPEYLGRQLSLT